jgi:uncharacterized protein (TIGR02145 family)
MTKKFLLAVRRHSIFACLTVFALAYFACSSHGGGSDDPPAVSSSSINGASTQSSSSEAPGNGTQSSSSEAPGDGTQSSSSQTACVNWSDWAVVPPTCENKGVKARSCIGDVSNTETEIIPQLEWSDWTITKHATQDEHGQETRTCPTTPPTTETRDLFACGAIDYDPIDEFCQSAGVVLPRCGTVTYTATEFCQSPNVVKPLCGTVPYTATQFCQAGTNVVKDLCGTAPYTATEFCQAGTNVVKDLCGGTVPFTATEFCQAGTNVVKDLCGGTVPFTATEFCQAGTNVVKDLCGGTVPFTATEFCQAGTNVVKDLCGTVPYTATQFCQAGAVTDKCGALEYTPAEFCQVGTNAVKPLCGTSNLTYTSAQFCIGGAVVDKQCGSVWYNSATHFCTKAPTNPKIVPLCGGQSYDTKIKQCVNNVIKNVATCEGFVTGQKREHYGQEKSEFCDSRDGTKYVYVDIGEQTWMAENLRYAGDGTVGRCAGSTDEDRATNCEKYGRLYNRDEAESKETGCPVGWRMPNEIDFDILLTSADPAFGPSNPVGINGNNAAAPPLKATIWQGTGSGSTGTDLFGFSALPGGYCTQGGTYGSICSMSADNPGSSASQIGNMSYWFMAGSSTAAIPIIQMRSNADRVDDVAATSDRGYNFYSRCIKNKSPSPKTPEPTPAAIACEGSAPSPRHKCHYGQWKKYFTDERDGKQYPYVEITNTSTGITYTWMAANLDYEATGSKCYNNLDANCKIFGRLYSWPVAMAGVYTSDFTETSLSTKVYKGICPYGWHLPVSTERAALTTVVGGANGNAPKLKAKSGWTKSTGTDDVGFAALPGSYGIDTRAYTTAFNNTQPPYDVDITADFGISRMSIWWNATEAGGAGTAIMLSPVTDNISNINVRKSRLHSVRCVKDDGLELP